MAERHGNPARWSRHSIFTLPLPGYVRFVLNEHAKGCEVAPAGGCPECTLAALFAIELRLTADEMRAEP
jgi:hypothetical protein